MGTLLYLTFFSLGGEEAPFRQRRGCHRLPGAQHAILPLPYADKGRVREKNQKSVGFPIDL